MGEAWGGDAEMPFGVQTAAGGERSSSSKLWNVAESELGRGFERAGRFDVAFARVNGPRWADSQRACEFKSKRSRQR